MPHLSELSGLSHYLEIGQLSRDRPEYKEHRRQSLTVFILFLLRIRFLSVFYIYHIFLRFLYMFRYSLSYSLYFILLLRSNCSASDVQVSGPVNYDWCVLQRSGKKEERLKKRLDKRLEKRGNT